jgi:hypothetical protein
LTSASYLETPNSPNNKLRVDISQQKMGSRAKNSVSFISAQPLRQYWYQEKLMLKNIGEYILMENNMIALITLPQSDEGTDEAYPRLLILLLPDLSCNQKQKVNDKSKGFWIYEIPSPLHIIDISQTKFLTSSNSLICLYGKDIIYWEITISKDEKCSFPNLLVNYGHWKCTQNFINLCPDEYQKVLNFVISPELDASYISSNTSFESKQEAENPVLVEKLYRRYLVTWRNEKAVDSENHTSYPPLFDVYQYQEATDDWDDSEVEVTVEDDNNSNGANEQSHNASIEEYKLEMLPNVLDKLYKEHISTAFDTILLFIQAYKKGEKALNLLENILNFETEYLTTKNVTNQLRLSILGKSILKQALHKIHERARYNSKLINGLKVLNRVHRYRSRNKIMKFWYLWKLVNSRTKKYDTNELSDEISTVMGETK